MEQQTYKRIPNRLRMCRLERGYKQIQVARVLGLRGTDQISQWENGVTLPTLINAFKLAGFYKVYVETCYFDLFNEIRRETTVKAKKVFDEEGLVQNPRIPM